MTRPGRAPDYRLREEHKITQGTDVITLPQGTWVRPVEWKYVPKHLMEHYNFKWANQTTEVACYTRFGFHVIPRSKVEVG